MSEFKNKVYIITGGSSGMGKAIASKLLSEGANVVINSRNEEKGLASLSELQKVNPVAGARFLAGDVGEVDLNQKLVETAINEFGQINGIVCNAGGLGLGSVTKVPLEIWKQTIDTNLNSIFYLSRFALPHMLKNGVGNILVNASIAAFKYFPNHPAYCAAKAGAVALTKQIATEYGPSIRANAICPGPVDTPLIWDSAKAFPNPEGAVQSAGASTAMKRLGLPSDIAELAIFLLSERSSWITGTAITIDGGAIFR